MKLFEISNYLDTRVPLALQEEYDNCGLLIGNKDTKITSILIALDCTEEVLDEAIKNKSNLIITHHPLLFKSIKKIIGSNYVEKIIEKAITNNIAIYAMHTNLDNMYGGVSFKIASKIALKNPKILKPKNNVLTKLTTYCPPTHTEIVKNALFEIGAGRVGQLYDRCSFHSNGQGSFRPLEGSAPYLGDVGKDEVCQEDKIEVIFYTYLKPKILSTLLNAHPYQEVSYIFTEMTNESQTGSGVIGDLKKEMTLINFLDYVKQVMGCNVIKYTNSNDKEFIKKVAVCGGAGSFLLDDAIRAKADVYISSDFKYHDFFETNNQINIFDIGHYESEYFTQELILEIVKEKFSKLAVHLTNVCTNPILYY